MRPAGTATAILTAILALAGRAMAQETPPKPTIFAGDVQSRWIAAAADGTCLAVADDTGCVRVLDAADGSVLVRLDDPGNKLRHVAFVGPDAATLVTTGRDVCIWNVARAVPVRRIPFPTKVETDNAAWLRECGLATCPANRLIAAALSDSRIQFWNTVTDRDAGSLTDAGHGFEAALSPDGSKFAVLLKIPNRGRLLYGRTVQVFDTVRRNVLWRDVIAQTPSDGGRALVLWNGVGFSPDGSSLMVTCNDWDQDTKVRFAAVCAYDVGKKKHRWTRRLEGRGVYSAAWSPRGDSIAAATSSGVILLDPTSGATRSTVSEGTELNQLCFSPDGRFLYGAVIGARGVLRWDVSQPIAVQDVTSAEADDAIAVVVTPVRFEGVVSAMSAAPDGRTLVAAELECWIEPAGPSRLRAYDLEKGTLRRAFGLEKTRIDLVSHVGGDADLLLSRSSLAPSASLWSVASGDRRTLLDDRPARPTGSAEPWTLGCMAASASRREVAVVYSPLEGSTNSAPRLCVTDAVTGRITGDLPRDPAPAGASRIPDRIAFSPDGLQLAALFTPQGPNLVVFRRDDASAPWVRGASLAHDGVAALALAGRTGWRDLTYSRDGRFVVVRAEVHSSDDACHAVVGAWEPAAGKSAWVVQTAPDNHGWGLAVSPAGGLFALSTSRGVVVLDIATGQFVRRLPGTTRVPSAIAYSADGRRLFAAVGQSLVAWDVGDLK